MENIIEQLKKLLSEAALNEIFSIIAGIAVLIVGFWLIKLTMKGLKHIKAFEKLDRGTREFLASVLSVFLKLVLILTVAAVIGVPSASIIALLGSVGLAVGLALQGSLSNFAGGVMIIMFKPFHVGDYIDTGDFAAGYVTDINVFYTTLRTLDDRAIVVPNAVLSNKSLTNYSLMPSWRVDIDVGLSYSTDIDTAKKIIFDAAVKNKYVKQEPSPRVLVKSFGDSAINFQLWAWCDNKDYWECMFSLNEEIKKALDKGGITIPFPQLDVHIEK